MAQAAETASWMAESAHEKVAGGGALYGRKLAYNNVKRNVQLGEEDAAEARSLEESLSAEEKSEGGAKSVSDTTSEGAKPTGEVKSAGEQATPSRGLLQTPIRMPEIIDSSAPPSSSQSVSEFAIARDEDVTEDLHNVRVDSEEDLRLVDTHSKSCPAVIIDNYESSDSSADGQEMATGARVVGGAALDSLFNVMGAFETAAWSVGRGVANATTDLLEHRYGRDVGEFSRDVSDSIGGGVTTIRSGLSMLPTSIALSAVHQAAKNDSLAQQAYSVVADEYKRKPRSFHGTESSHSAYSSASSQNDNDQNVKQSVQNVNGPI